MSETYTFTNKMPPVAGNRVNRKQGAPTAGADARIPNAARTIELMRRDMDMIRGELGRLKGQVEALQDEVAILKVGAAPAAAKKGRGKARSGADEAAGDPPVDDATTSEE